MISSARLWKMARSSPDVDSGAAGGGAGEARRSSILNRNLYPKAAPATTPATPVPSAASAPRRLQRLPGQSGAGKSGAGAGTIGSVMRRDLSGIGDLRNSVDASAPA